MLVLLLGLVLWMVCSISRVFFIEWVMGLSLFMVQYSVMVLVCGMWLQVGCRLVVLQCMYGLMMLFWVLLLMVNVIRLVVVVEVGLVLELEEFLSGSYGFMVWLLNQMLLSVSVFRLSLVISIVLVLLSLWVMVLLFLGM